MTDTPQNAQHAMSDITRGPHVLTIGNFDGVHRGHQHLLANVTARSKEIGAPSLVITFEPHPTVVLRPEHAQPRIATPGSKVKLLRAVGIDEVAIIPFDRAFASLLPDEFLTLVYQSACPTDIFVGDDFRFGKMRAGDIPTIEQFGKQHGFETHIVHPLADASGVVSSTRVREALLAGDVEDTASLLGRRYRLTGSVEHGLARGRDLGYPTANLELPTSMCVPHDGIYAGYARFSDGSAPHEAMIYIGTSPTFGERERLVEVNILDYRGNLYSHELEIEFVAFVRADCTFDTAEELMAQMADDEATTRRIMGATQPETTLRGD